MSYLSYADYRTWGGTMEETDFNRYEYRAEKLIDEETFGRVKEISPVPEEVKRLTFELVTLVQKADVSNDTVSSERVGNWQKSYRGVSQAAYTRAGKSIIRTYLSGIYTSEGVPLLYRGCDV